MAEIKKSSSHYESRLFCKPNISVSGRDVKMSMNVKSTSDYSGVDFTFGSLMTKLSKEEEQHVVNFPHTKNLIVTRKIYAASQMVDIAKEYYENGYKVFIFLRSSGYNLDIDFQKMSVPAGAASAASPFRSKKSQRSRSKSAKKRRNLKNKSKSKSKKRSPKPRRR